MTTQFELPSHRCILTALLLVVPGLFIAPTQEFIFPVPQTDLAAQICFCSET
jgi:hypothetical protein